MFGIGPAPAVDLWVARSVSTLGQSIKGASGLTTTTPSSGLLPPAGEPPAICAVFNNLDYDNDAFSIDPDYSVEQPPEAGKVFDVEIFQPILPTERGGDGGLPDYFSVQTICKQYGFEGVNSPCDCFEFVRGGLFQSIQ